MMASGMEDVTCACDARLGTASRASEAPRTTMSRFMGEGASRKGPAGCLRRGRLSSMPWRPCVRARILMQPETKDFRLAPARMVPVLGAALVGVALVQPAWAQNPPYDLLLKNGRVVDGTGSPWSRADGAIRGDAIVRIAASITDPATRVIDVAGRVIAPGFIDIHSHARRGIFEGPTADNDGRMGG